MKLHDSSPAAELESVTEAAAAHGNAVGSNPDHLPTISVPDLGQATAPAATVNGASVSFAPACIGEYRILGLLGEGGMGIVWEAEQQHPRRRVALKVFRHGHQVDELHARMFHHEAEILGRLRHPMIAAIYESGHTEEGHDFFAMELVRGDTLHAWLRSRPAPPGPDEIRLKLLMFTHLCEAVHYAHQRGVIHRDLKPRNIIVSDETGGSVANAGAPLPSIKILDFGLARITDADAQAISMMSEMGAIKGTLPFMSPEQALGDAHSIDLRTDVYALGVILYEMLTLKRPYDLEAMSLVDAVQVICNEPPRPLRECWSASSRLDPDLQTIVATALAKEPAKRYSSAAALADDVRRLLASQPIAARPPSRAYRARKFARRHRVGVATSAGEAHGLLLGFIGTTSGLIRAKRAEASARRQAADSERVSQFIADMLASVDPHQVGLSLIADLEEGVAEAAIQRGATPTEETEAVAALRHALRGVSSTDTGRRLVDQAVLSRAGEAIAKRFGDRPDVAGRLEHTLAETYQRLGLYQPALTHAERAVAGRREALGADDPMTLRSQNLLGTLTYRQGLYQQAETMLRATLAAQRRTLGGEHPDALLTARSLSWVYIDQGRLDEAEQLLVPTVEAQRRLLGDDHVQTMTSMNSLAVVYTDQKRLAEAEQLHTALLTTRSATLGPTHPDTLKSMTNLAILCFYQGRLEDAEALFRKVLETQREVLGPAHPTALGSANNLAVICERLNRLNEAERLHRETLDVKQQVLGPHHPETLSSAYNLAVLFTQQGRFAEAESLHLGTLAARQEALGECSPETLDSWTALAGVAALSGNRVLAIERLSRAVANGHADPDTLGSDPDFAMLRGGPEFREIVERARRNREEQPDEPG